MKKFKIIIGFTIYLAIGLIVYSVGSEAKDLTYIEIILSKVTVILFWPLLLIRRIL